MARLFGTDGVRGVANTELTPELAMALGKAGACVLAESEKRPLILIAKDTRISGDMLEVCSDGRDFVHGGRCDQGRSTSHTRGGVSRERASCGRRRRDLRVAQPLRNTTG